MITNFDNIIKTAYLAFNDRDINSALLVMHPNVLWSKAWEGGYISGHEEIRKYWTRQWSEINPKVYPIGFELRADNKLEVLVHQIVKDLNDVSIFDGNVKHVYLFENKLIKTMDIELI